MKTVIMSAVALFALAIFLFTEANAAEPFSVLGGAQVQALTSTEMDAVQGKVTAFDLAQQGAFFQGNGFFGWLYNPDNENVSFIVTVNGVPLN